MSANEKFINVYRHPQAAKQADLIALAQSKGCTNSQIVELLDACAEDQRAADKALGEKVRADMNSYNAHRGRGRHRQVITPEQAPQAPQAQSESRQPQVEQLDQAAFEADALAAAKSFGKSHGRKASA